jgi:hypothetical protein
MFLYRSRAGDSRGALHAKCQGEHRNGTIPSKLKLT